MDICFFCLLSMFKCLLECHWREEHWQQSGTQKSLKKVRFRGAKSGQFQVGELDFKHTCLADLSCCWLHLSILRKKNGWVENNWFVLTFINKITNDWYFIASDIHYFFDHILFKLYEKIFSVNLKKIEICLISLKMTLSIPRPKYCICARTIWSHWANWLIHSLK